MKSENQTIVQRKAANKNREAAITVFVDVFLQRRWKKNSSDCFVIIFFFCFSVFISSMPSKVIIIDYSNTNYVRARAEMSLSRAQNIFMLANFLAYGVCARSARGSQNFSVLT